MIKLLRLTLFAICLCLAHTSVNAQDQIDLQDYEDFFLDKEPALNKWLGNSNLAKYIEYRNLEVNESQVNFSFKSSNWESLTDSVKNNTGIPLEELLMDKLQFIFNLEPEQLLININTGSQTLFLEYKLVDGALILSSETRKNMGTISGNLAVAVEGLNLSNSETYTSDQTIAILKKKLSSALNDYFKEKEVRYKFGKYSMKPYFGIKNRLKIKVKNVQNIVKKGFYEAINIDFLFAEEGDNVTINYTLNCKYGSGIFFSPFEEDYAEVDEKKMENFNDDLQEIILNALTN